MKIGLAQINTTTGDFEGNSKKILRAAKMLREQGAELAIFPELSLCGILPKDKCKSENFLAKNEEFLSSLAKELPLPALVGAVGKSDGARGAKNSLFFITNGKIVSRYDKHLLPNYAFFEEPRYFDEGEDFCVINFNGKKIALTICEDIWTLDSNTSKFYANQKTPLEFLKSEKLDLLVNVSASLWSAENETARAELLPSLAKYVNAPVAFCNLVGGNDEMVCAGKSAVLSKNGEYAKVLAKFEEDSCVVDLDDLPKIEVPKFDRIAEMYGALKMAFADFVRKSGFKKVLLGLSGGIDSAFVAALACDSIGAKNVIGVSLPSKYSSLHSVSDAESLAKNCGLEYHSIAIADVVASEELALSEIFKDTKKDVTEENLQSRTRGLLLMAISNKFGAMLLATGNKSECAVGYCTLYGDTNGGFAPIADIYKTDIYKLSNYVNRYGEIIPLNTIQKPPSAELRPDQKDSDSLPEYPVLDAILHAYIEENLSIKKIVEKGFDEEVVVDVIKKFERNEYKRRQLAPAPRLTISSFGASRKIALTDRKSYEFQ